MGELWGGTAAFALQAGAGDLKREIVPARCETDGLPVGQAAVLGFELAVDQAMRRTEVVAVVGLRDDRHFELGAITKIVVAR
ncbi:hypothetical protein OG558_40505 [Kribbella sp. NBC_01510]|uniref:hypothetical protein n=1 Tax=Kribbella sp. NBC_01510 TaxID=2903581 RepID=UPI00386E8A96